MLYNFKLVKHIKFCMAFSLISVKRKPKPDGVELHGLNGCYGTVFSTVLEVELVSVRVNMIRKKERGTFRWVKLNEGLQSGNLR